MGITELYKADIFIRILSGPHPLMVRGGFYRGSMILLISINRYRTIVDNLFHSLWNYKLGRRAFLAGLPDYGFK